MKRNSKLYKEEFEKSIKKLTTLSIQDFFADAYIRYQEFKLLHENINFCEIEFAILITHIWIEYFLIESIIHSKNADTEDICRQVYILRDLLKNEGIEMGRNLLEIVISEFQRINTVLKKGELSL